MWMKVYDKGEHNTTKLLQTSLKLGAGGEISSFLKDKFQNIHQEKTNGFKLNDTHYIHTPRQAEER